VLWLQQYLVWIPLGWTHHTFVIPTLPEKLVQMIKISNKLSISQSN